MIEDADFKTERQFVELLAHFLSDSGFHVRLEAPNMGRSMDILAVKGGRYFAIEAKLHFWKGALRQCRAHSQVADLLYVAVATKGVSQDLIDEASSLGIGIIHYDRTVRAFRFALRARKNRNVWMPQRRFFSRQIKRVPSCRPITG